MPRRMRSWTFSAPGRFSKKVIRALASRTMRFIVRGVLQLALALPFFEQVLKSGWFAAERPAQTADKFRSERLENETIFLFDEGHLRPLVNGVFAAKLCGDDELTLGGDGGNFGLHAGSRSPPSR